jgi:hypothetical protein
MYVLDINFIDQILYNYLPEFERIRASGYEILLMGPT